LTASDIPAGENQLRGVMLVLFATFSFALSDILAKHLMSSFPVPVVMGARYVISATLLFVFLYPRLGARLWKTERTLLVIVRGALLSAASLTMGIALSLMPVGEVVAIMYLSPFAVMIIAIPLLGERVPLAGWIGAIIAFLGVLLIIRPGSGLNSFGVIMALVNAAIATAYHLTSRVLVRTETTVAMLFYTSLVGVMVFAVLAAGSITAVSISPIDGAMMLALGILATLGHYFFTAAYRHAPASVLAPMNYVHLVWAAGLSTLIFGHIPDIITFAGMVLVAGAGLAIAVRAHLGMRRTASKMPLTPPEA
jgi:drug/metabolite transporter (DMT)-like permease